MLSEFNSYIYLTVASTTLWAVVLYVPKTDQMSSQRRWQPVRLAFVGLVLMLLCYVPFLLAPSHMAITQRTYLCATPGAAMFWVAMIMQFWYFSKPMARSITFILILFGLGAQLFQFNHYVTLADRQRTYLRNIVENFDGGSGSETLVVLDESNELGDTWMLLPDGLMYALSYIYGHPIARVEICHIPSNEWKRPGALARNGVCIDTKDEWILRYPSSVNGPDYTHPAVPDDVKITKKTIVTLVIHPDGSVSQSPALNEYRGLLTTSNDTVALRYRGFLFTNHKSTKFNLFKEQARSNSYRWDFGDWWSLDLPIRGSGWRPAEWAVNSFDHQAQAWKTTEKSSLFFDLTPAPNPYLLQGRFSTFLNDSIKNSLQIRLNHHDLAFKWISPTVFEAVIPKGVLKSSSNEIEFNTSVDSNYFGLSAALDYFKITPINHTK